VIYYCLVVRSCVACRLGYPAMDSSETHCPPEYIKTLQGIFKCVELVIVRESFFSVNLRNISQLYHCFVSEICTSDSYCIAGTVEAGLPSGFWLIVCNFEHLVLTAIRRH